MESDRRFVKANTGLRLEKKIVNPKTVQTVGFNRLFDWKKKNLIQSKVSNFILKGTHFRKW